MSRRVVITGIGIYSCIGKNLTEVKDSLYKGKSGIIYEAERKPLGYRSALTGYVDLPDLKPFLSRRDVLVCTNLQCTLTWQPKKRWKMQNLILIF